MTDREWAGAWTLLTFSTLSLGVVAANGGSIKLRCLVCVLCVCVCLRPVQRQYLALLQFPRLRLSVGMRSCARTPQQVARTRI